MIEYPDKTKPASEQSPVVLLAMCIFGEARGEEHLAKEGVASCVRNRVMSDITWWKKGKGATDWHKVILQPFAFSSFLSRDPNLKKLFDPLKYESPEVWAECYRVAEACYNGILKDPTESADHYFDDSIRSPKWAKAKDFTVKIGRLNFYRIEIKIDTPIGSAH